MTAVERVMSRHRGRFRRFDRIPVPPLSRPAARCLVRLATDGVEVESPGFLENHLAFRTGGHPGAILGCIEYLRRAEPAITCQAVRDLPFEFYGPQKYLDLTPAFALVAFFLIAYRFLSLGLEDEELYSDPLQLDTFGGGLSNNRLHDNIPYFPEVECRVSNSAGVKYPKGGG